MKIAMHQIMALCVVWGTTASAFVVKPQSQSTTALHSTSYSFSPQGGPPPPGTAPAVGPAPGTPLTSSGPMRAPAGGYRDSLSAIWDTSERQERVEGGSLRTWSVDPMVDMMHVSLGTEGRPLNANLELWHGPDYTPSNLKIYSEDGELRPFHAVVFTPLAGNTIAIYNTAEMEFPFSAVCEARSDLCDAPFELEETGGKPKTVQGGGMVASYPFETDVDSVQILLKTDGRNLKARIELLQGPNNNKQILEYYSSDGNKRPFYAVVQTPGSGNVVRIQNQNTVEFPFLAIVKPFELAE